MNLQDARALFTKTLVDVYQQRTKVPGFLRSMFPVKTSPTKTISIEVERVGELIAVDVVRGTEGNRNSFSTSTEKIFTPPLFREYFDATQLDLYDRVLGSQGNAQVPLFAALLNSVSNRLGLLQDKIERAYEKQCADVLTTGIVTIVAGTNIDFKRKAASIIDISTLATPLNAYWDAGVDLFAQLTVGCNFLRTVGKSSDGAFNLICGDLALAALLTNTKFLARQNLFNMILDAVTGPVRNSEGAAFHGTLTCGAYKVHLWSYPQFYTDASNNQVPYIPSKLVVMVPMNPRFILSHAAVPQLIGEPGQLPIQAAYVVGEFVDERKAVHDFDIQSAGVAIPVAVDQIWTAQVLA